MSFNLTFKLIMQEMKALMKHSENLKITHGRILNPEQMEFVYTFEDVLQISA